MENRRGSSGARASPAAVFAVCTEKVIKASSGVFALQIHSGGAMEVRFKNLKLEVN